MRFFFEDGNVQGVDTIVDLFPKNGNINEEKESKKGTQEVEEYVKPQCNNLIGIIFPKECER